MARFQLVLVITVCMAIFLLASIAEEIEAFDSGWYDAHATFYGDMDGVGTMEGACGYGNLKEQGYGLETTALSVALFQNGQACGACYEIMCVNDPQWCIPNAGTIKVTATNLCPANYSKPNENWCNPPQKHFDLTMPMFLKLASKKEAGVIPVRYRRAPCSKTGGMKFEIKGNPNFIMVLVYNVGGVGDVVDVKIKGSNTNWLQMKRNWGDKWNTGTPLGGQSLSFQVTTDDGKMVQSDNVAPANWQFGKVYEGKNF